MARVGNEIERNFETNSDRSRWPKWPKGKRPYVLLIAGAFGAWYYLSPDSTVVSHGTIEGSGLKHRSTAKRMSPFNLEIAGNIATAHIRLDKSIFPEKTVTYKIKDKLDGIIMCGWTWEEFEQKAEIITIDEKTALGNISKREVTISVDFEPGILDRKSLENSETAFDESEERRYEGRDIVKDYFGGNEEIAKRMKELRDSREPRVLAELRSALIGKDSPVLRFYLADKIYESYIGRRGKIEQENFPTTLIVNITWGKHKTTHTNIDGTWTGEDEFKQ